MSISAAAAARLQQGVENMYLNVWDVFGGPITLLAAGIVLIDIGAAILKAANGELSGEITTHKIIAKGLWIGGGITLLINPDHLWNLFFGAMVDIPSYFGSRILAFTGGYESPETGLVGFLDVIETNFFFGIWTMIAKITTDVDILDGIAVVITVGILIVTYGYFLFLCIRTAVQSFVEIYVLGFFSPFWIAFMMFEQTRSIFWHSIQVLLTAVFNLIAVAIAIGITFATTGDTFALMQGDDLSKMSEQPLGNRWLNFLVVGMFMVFMFGSVMKIPSYVLRTFLGADGGNASLAGMFRSVVGLVTKIPAK